MFCLLLFDICDSTRGLRKIQHNPARKTVDYFRVGWERESVIKSVGKKWPGIYSVG